MRKQDFFSRSVGYSLLAARMGLVIKKWGKSKALSEREVGILAAGEKFIEMVKEGRRKTQNGIISESALPAANAYGDAIQAMRKLFPRGQSMPPGIEEFLSSLCETIREVREGREPASEKIDYVARFFSVLREVTVEQNSKPMETVSLP